MRALKYLIALLGITGIAAAQNMAPSISSLNPSSVIAGTSTFPLIVTGTNLTGGVVNWNGAPLPTTPNSSTQLTAQVASSLVAVTGAAVITVTTPAGTSVQQPFYIEPPPLAITSISPNVVVAGSGSFILNVTGTSFETIVLGVGAPSAGTSPVVHWTSDSGVDTPLETTFIDSSHLAAVVPASLDSVPGIASITVVVYGEVRSNAVPLTIAARPVLAAILPSSTAAGGSAFTLTLTGSGFSGGPFAAPSAVRWTAQTGSVTMLATTFVNPTQLVASVPAALITSSGKANLDVVNPGDIVSNALPFIITPPALLITNAALPGTSASG
ncbi:MAG: hypothetical protein M1541_08785, partial [Acidobacteria bacterium]|nr:hypothetical protein [Acidobacteriota bacterium]